MKKFRPLLKLPSKTNKKSFRAALLEQGKVIALLYINNDMSLPDAWNALTEIKNKLERLNFDEEHEIEEDYSNSLKDCID